MKHAKRMLSLVLGGVAALSLMAPVNAAAEAELPTEAIAPGELREQAVFEITLDREGKEQEIRRVRLLLPEDAKEIPVEEQKKLLEEGWVLSKEEPYPIPEGELKIQIERAKRELKIHYVTEEGRTVHTELLQVPVDKTQVVATDLKEIPGGYTLVNHVDSPIAGDTQSVEILVRAEKRELKVHYVTADGKVVHTEQLTVAPDKDRVVATDLRELPGGYTLVHSVDVELLPTTTAIEVLVQKDEPVPTEKVISVHYTTKDGKKVHTSSMTVAVDASSVEVTALKDVPNGYVLVSKGSLPIDRDNAIHPMVEEKKKDQNKDDVPRTGDPTPALMGLSGLSLGAAALVSGLKKKLR